MIGVPPDQRENFQEVKSTYENVHPGVWRPEVRAEDYDKSNVFGAVVFPDFFAGFANPYFGMGDQYELRAACVRAHNDWEIDEFCAATPGRNIPLAMVPLWDMDAAVAEVNRSAKIGHKGVAFGGSMDRLGYPWLGDPYWYPMYQAIQDNDMVLSIHRMGLFAHIPTLPMDKENLGLNRSKWTNNMCASIYTTNELVGSGILEMFPTLRVLIAEGGTSWIPYCLQQLDYGSERLLGKEGLKGLTMLPSEYFRRQVYSGFWYEQIDQSTLDICGEDNICWEQDYPHTISPWPDNKGSFEYSTQLISNPTVRRKLAFGNVAKLFKVDVPMGATTIV
jgi:predicted TIM-barrel fold metal-dependent hydrolase